MIQHLRDNEKAPIAVWSPWGKLPKSRMRRFQGIPKAAPGPLLNALDPYDAEPSEERAAKDADCPN